MTKHDFELTVNMLIVSNRTITAIKFIRQALNRRHDAIGLKDCKTMIDSAAKGIKEHGVPFRINHFDNIILRSHIDKLRMAKYKLAQNALTNL